ncbi:component of SufBCD complex [Thioclava sp. BHET1]|nr:component of SufBCD complex [Thioclava sp. BHET1]
MEIFRIIADLIDLRSFSNLWYWIAVAVVWSSASHWVLGVPWDMVGRARRKGGRATSDLVALAEINARRLDTIWSEAGLVISIMFPFALSFLAVTGFVYGAEFSQALFLFALPLSAVFALSVSLSRRLSAQFERSSLAPEAVIAALARHRVWIQLIGVVAIVVTSFWGMFQNLRYAAFL